MIFKKLAFQLFWMLVPLSWCVSQDWKDHYHFNPQQTLNRIKFLDGMTGFTAGSLYNGSTENIHITHDGGKTWTDASSGYTAMRFMDIFIQDLSTIFMSGNEGLVIRSKDGGKSWQTMNTNTKEQLWGIYFTSAEIGFAVGSNGIIIRTKNGGNDWETIPTGINNLFYDVYFTPQGIGFASGSNTLWKTDDLGLSWYPIADFPFEAPADWIRCIKMVNEKVGFACADIGRIYKTEDGGDHWERLESGVQEPLFDLDFVDELHGIVCGFNGTILKTDDGGLSWTPMISPLGIEHLYSIDLISKDLGFICTHTGRVLKLNMASGTHLANTDLITVYPNPSTNYIKLKLNAVTQSEVKQINICTMNGSINPVHGHWLNDHELRINIPLGCVGMATVQIESEHKIITLPIIILNAE